MIKKLLFLIIAISFVFAAGDQEDLIIDIEKSLIAPCCWSGTVYDHGHPQLEDEIAAFVKDGLTKDEILEHYIAKYGERILASPIAKGFNLFAWIVPIVILGVGLFIMITYIRSPKEEKAQPTAHPKKTEYDDEIEKELESFDQ